MYNCNISIVVWWIKPMNVFLEYSCSCAGEEAAYTPVNEISLSFAFLSQSLMVTTSSGRARPNPKLYKYDAGTM